MRLLICCLSLFALSAPQAFAAHEDGMPETTPTTNPPTTGGADSTQTINTKCPVCGMKNDTAVKPAMVDGRAFDDASTLKPGANDDTGRVANRGDAKHTDKGTLDPEASTNQNEKLSIGACSAEHAAKIKANPEMYVHAARRNAAVDKNADPSKTMPGHEGRQQGKSSGSEGLPPTGSSKTDPAGPSENQPSPLDAKTGVPYTK